MMMILKKQMMIQMMKMLEFHMIQFLIMVLLIVFVYIIFHIFYIQCLPGRPQIVGVWSDQGVVSIYNIAPQLSALENGQSAANQEGATKPVFQFKGHRSEGYAIDWSRCDKGKLATGDCNAKIYITSPTETGWTTDNSPFISHKGSVEDLQWSPSESTVFASASVDRTIKIWDTRNRNHTSMLSVNAHDSDVNVINWNK